MDDKIPSYKEFVAQYGNRPKDIIYDMAVKLAEDFYRKPGRLLTPEERKPYWHDYKEGHWHIEALLQAQLDQREE